MKGAIFYSTKYGSTAEYANWISEATGLPAFDVTDPRADPIEYDFLVLGSSVRYYKLTIRKWLKANAQLVRTKPTILFTVSGAGAGPKLDGWLADSRADSLISKMDHVALRGRSRRGELTRLDRMMQVIGGLKNPDRQARKEELEGFDYMDKSSIAPIVEKIEALLTSEEPASH